MELNFLLAVIVVAYACTLFLTFSYDIERLQVLNFVTAHKDDVNSVAWDNKNTSHIVYTGGDDCNIFVWDRRIIGKGQKPAGVLIGHQEGITHVSSQGDSLHLISNGKDQFLKYWDIRKRHPISKMKSMPPLCRQPGFDYRSQNYNYANCPKHPCDCSARDFKGHTVLRTLIRCDFSPLETTGQRYIYTGSSSGAVFIYDLLGDGKPSKILLTDVDNSDEEDWDRPIRDVSWHPKYPLIVAPSFNRNIYGWKYKEKTFL